MNIKATFSTTEQNIKAAFSENITMIPSDDDFENTLDSIIEEQTEIIDIQKQGGYVV